MELIDKAALVAKIERKIDKINQFDKIASYEVGMVDAYKIVLSFIDTIEVKEVDLKKELSYEDYVGFFKEHPNFPDDWGFDEAWVFAKHFFELGMSVSNKAQKGE